MPEQTRSYTPMKPDSERMAGFLASFLELPCTHFWRGHGSAMFLEFGILCGNGLRRDGSSRNPRGQWSVCLDFSWRIEGKRLIWCGSGDEEDDCATTFGLLVGKKVVHVDFDGRLPELHLRFENGLHATTFTTDAGNPTWSLMKELPNGYQALCAHNGKVVLETCEENSA